MRQKSARTRTSTRPGCEYQVLDPVAQGETPAPSLPIEYRPLLPMLGLSGAIFVVAVSRPATERNLATRKSSIQPPKIFGNSNCRTNSRFLGGGRGAGIAFYRTSQFFMLALCFLSLPSFPVFNSVFSTLCMFKAGGCSAGRHDGAQDQKLSACPFRHQTPSCRSWDDDVAAHHHDEEKRKEFIAPLEGSHGDDRNFGEQRLDGDVRRRRCSEHSEARGLQIKRSGEREGCIVPSPHFRTAEHAIPRKFSNNFDRRWPAGIRSIRQPTTK
jgi:hypothetical protein